MITRHFEFWLAFRYCEIFEVLKTGKACRQMGAANESGVTSFRLNKLSCHRELDDVKAARNDSFREASGSAKMATSPFRYAASNRRDNAFSQRHCPN